MTQYTTEHRYISGKWNEETQEAFRRHLVEEEKSSATVEKYLRDVRYFFRYVGEHFMQEEKAAKGPAITKEQAICYKEELMRHYAVSSVNSMLASVNHFFKWMGWYDCVVKSLKVQKTTFRAGEKELTREEYLRLLHTARKKKNERLYCLMQTLCATGIRVSELPFITVQAITRGRAQVSLKNKIRTVLLPEKLCRLLKQYIRKKNITSGSIFITRSGQPLDRSNILHDMKKLCREAQVEESKVFPHNLRHLFACTYYHIKKDIVHLADILGHSNINTTRIYTLESGKEESRLLSRLGLII
ncbi:MAG: tyrosine-type recombinase/integrase [Clostridiales bacterium]|nr:tyrosine-type recombinase/integrase [Clostridiales bacterium]